MSSCQEAAVLFANDGRGLVRNGRRNAGPGHRRRLVQHPQPNDQHRPPAACAAQLGSRGRRPRTPDQVERHGSASAGFPAAIVAVRGKSPEVAS